MTTDSFNLYPCCHCERNESEELKIHEIPVLFANPKKAVCHICDECLAVSYTYAKEFLCMSHTFGKDEGQILDLGRELLHKNQELALKAALSQIGGKE